MRRIINQNDPFLRNSRFEITNDAKKRPFSNMELEVAFLLRLSALFGEASSDQGSLCAHALAAKHVGYARTGKGPLPPPAQAQVGAHHFF